MVLRLNEVRARRKAERDAKFKELAKDIAIGAALVVLFIGAPVALTYWANAAKCEARWAGTAPAQFGVFAGCRVLLPNGQWVPEDRYRFMDMVEVAP